MKKIVLVVAVALFVSSNTYAYENEVWTPIDEQDLYFLISGNTLITQHKSFCEDPKSSSPCLLISVLSSRPKEKRRFYVLGGRYDATLIIPDKKKIIKTDWGVFSKNGISCNLNMGVTSIPENYVERWVSVNSNKTAFRIQFKRGELKGQELIVLIKKGSNDFYLKQAAKSNFSTINNRGKLSLSQQLLKKGIEAMLPKGGGDSSSSSSNSHYKEFTGITILKKDKVRTWIRCNGGFNDGIEHTITSCSNGQYAVDTMFGEGCYYSTFDKAVNYACDN